MNHLGHKKKVSKEGPIAGCLLWTYQIKHKMCIESRKTLTEAGKQSKTECEYDYVNALQVNGNSYLSSYIEYKECDTECIYIVKQYYTREIHWDKNLHRKKYMNFFWYILYTSKNISICIPLENFWKLAIFR